MTQYACFNCERDLTTVNTYTTVKSESQIKGCNIKEGPIVEVNVTYECPFCKTELSDSEFESTPRLVLMATEEEEDGNQILQEVQSPPDRSPEVS